MGNFTLSGTVTQHHQVDFSKQYSSDHFVKYKGILNFFKNEISGTFPDGQFQLTASDSGNLFSTALHHNLGFVSRISPNLQVIGSQDAE